LLFVDSAEILEESEERTYLIQDLRNRIIQRTEGRGLQQRELLETVFREIDTDGSGEINRTEFKSLLAQMDLGYSGKKFLKLYNIIDRNGDGSLSLAELNHLLFPQDAKQKEVEELGLKVQSCLDRRINALENEHLGESDTVSLGVHRKRLGQISSLKSLSEATWKQTMPTSGSKILVDFVSEKSQQENTPTANDKRTPFPLNEDDLESSQRKHISQNMPFQSLPPLSHKDSLSLSTNKKVNQSEEKPTQDSSQLHPVFSSPKHVSHRKLFPLTNSNSGGVSNFDSVESSSPTPQSENLIATESFVSLQKTQLTDSSKRLHREAQTHPHPRIKPKPIVEHDSSVKSHTFTGRTAVI
jgi:hypothetical protein